MPTQSPFIGTRVRIPVYTDDWMKGDRYGTIVRHYDGDETIKVKLDISGKTRKFLFGDCETIG